MNTSDKTHRHPRITRAYAKSQIAVEKITVDTELLVVFAIVKLKCGQRLVADAIVANSATFDAECGTQIVRDKIIDQIIKLEMYDLRKKLYEQKQKEVGHAD